MVILQIECQQVISSNFFEFQSDSSYLFLLTRSPMRFIWKGDSTVHPAGQCIYCAPGERLRLEVVEQYSMIDYVEFGLNEEEQALYASLSLPVGASSPPNFSVLASLLKNMHYLVYSADRYRAEKGDLFLRSLLYSTASGDETPIDNSKQGLLYYKLRQLQKAISDDPRQYESVVKAAAFVGVSPSWFAHIYKSYFGISYVNNLIRCKMEHACTLLQSTDWTIERIAHELGYMDETYFYRLFKQRCGVSPGEYRSMEFTVL